MRNLFKYCLSNYKIIAISILFVVDILICLVYGLSRSIEIPTFHLDGAFQTASGLFRLEAGQLPGRDFIPYLGLGLTLFIFPVFVAFGGDLAASGAATHMLVALSYALSVAIISALLVESRKILFGAIVGSIFLGLSLWESHNFFVFLADRFTPGNSLRPLRSFVSYIAVVLVYMLLKSRMKMQAVFYSMAGLAGIFFYWSNDFGTVVSGLLILFTGSLIFYRKSASAGLLLKVLIVYLSSLMILSVLLTGFHPRELVAYNFFDVRKDQWWYFGPWSEESRIFGIRDFLPKILMDFGFWGDLGFWCMIGPVGLLLLVVWRPRLENLLLLLLGLMLAAGGLLSIIGGHRDIGYISAFHFWCQIVTIVGALVFLGRIALKPSFFGNYLKSDFVYWLYFFFGASTLIIGLTVLTDLSKSYHLKIDNIGADRSMFYVNELGGFLPIAYSDLVDYARQEKNSSVLEEYWGIFSAVTRKTSVVPVDSVIHALGNMRSVFLLAIEAKPDIVVTTRRSMEPNWQAWSFSANYWFYKPLIENYAPFKITPSTIIWKKIRTSL